MDQIWLWVGFNLFVMMMLAIDLGIFHRDAHEVSVREAGGWIAVWVSLSLTFGLGVTYFMGTTKGLEYYTGYLIEQALSVDNIFVFVLIFTYFGVPRQYQHRVLFWGILGALEMRGTMIGAGAYLVARFHWILYLFGAFLVYTGIRMATQDEQAIEPEANPMIKLVRRILPVSSKYHGQNFFIRESLAPGAAPQLVATPLFVVLVLVETTDVLFAVDSIPAIFGVTHDPFIIYTSNIFAILGLRSLYFLLAGAVDKFHLLKYGLALVLTFVGLKMTALSWVFEGHFPIGWSLGIIAGTIGLSIAFSLAFPKKEEGQAANS
jgi:tellurite resistance protein TerC